MKAETVKNIIVIGASAGGIAAVSRLASTFKSDLDAAIFVVIHLSPLSKSDVILNFIQKQTFLKCKIAKEGERMELGTIYLAPTDYHMMVERNYIRVRKGGYENHWRPAIDVLFRSAALAYNSCVTGIILSGLLDDGTSGMLAIKRCGGKCMVQNPDEAEFPDMAQNVLQQVEVDYNVSIDEMIYILLDLYAQGACVPAPVPDDIKLETSIALQMTSSFDDLVKLGDLTPFTCPDCGGILAKITDGSFIRYRCYTGHAFTLKSLELKQIKAVEESLWVAIRIMEERKNLLNKMASGSSRSQEIDIQIDRLKLLLLEVGKNTEIN
ncbi:two-component system chemotaxis response regulator CheB [Pedobacter sp. CAN_A7]|uniref:chemotaxis protein CheB n=1 Tax=Pedobacter sp. CAN_A7 TaxID=2787722 RepID=UPI0018CAD7F7